MAEQQSQQIKPRSGNSKWLAIIVVLIAVIVIFGVFSEGQISNLNSKLNTKSSDITSLHNQLNNSNASIASLKTQLNNDNATIASLKTLPTMIIIVNSSTTTGQSLTFAAFIFGGTPSNVIFNFGDGATGTATLLSGYEYTVAHSYSSAGEYLVTANTTVNGKNINNLNILEITVSPAIVTP